MRSGVRLALDWGKARIGVAASDPEGILAHPVTTLATSPAVFDEVAALIVEYQPIEVILGLPRNLAGAEGPAAQYVQQVASELVPWLGGVPLRLVDERMTTVQASRQMSGAGRRARQQRAVIDQAAAVALLDQALTYERATGGPMGQLVAERTTPDE